MTGKAVTPRGLPSILFIGTLVGPGFLMLWLGRWKWALFYFAVALAATIAIGQIEAAGLLDARPVLSFFTAGDLVSMAVQAAVAIGHALVIRRDCLTRPWYRWIAAVPALLYVAALVLFLPLRIFVVQPFSIPSASLFPTLVPGDYVVVSKSAYGYSRYSFPFGLASFDGRIWGSTPERGDVAVFKLPSDTSVDYVKRVIGLPGEHIRMVGGTLVINDEPVPRTQVEVADDYRGDAGVTFWRETLPNGRSYVVAEAEENGEADNTHEFIVPEGYYFVLGDNRDNSQDSRYLAQVGYVPLENFIGPVSMLLFNMNGAPVGNRPQ